MAVIAVTGDIGAGKSTVSKILAEKLGCERLDADVIAKSLWLRDDVKAQAVNRWGEKILDTSGKILIPEIAKIIFNDETENKFCNSMLHPLAMAELERQSRENKNIVLEIPLLFEAGSSFDWINFVVYVTANFDVRTERCRVSRGWSIEELRRREKMLLSQREKISMSDFVINNGGNISELEWEIDAIIINFH